MKHQKKAKREVTNEQIQTIQAVVKRVCHKYVFGYFSVEDIQQEAFIIGYKAVEEIWDGKRPLENFLSIHIPNRLKNFKRDNYYRLDIPDIDSKRNKNNNNKKKLMEATELFEFDLTENNSVLDKLVDSEFWSTVYNSMPNFVKSDFKRLLNNVSIPSKRRNQVLNFVKDFYENW